MKGQSINVDWIVGLTVFLAALVAATTTVMSSSDVRTDSGLESKAEETVSNIRSSLTTEAVFTPLYVRQPYDTGKIPVNLSYYSDNTGSGFLNTTSRLERDNNRVIAVLDSGNNSYKLSSFEGEVSHGFKSNISGGEWLENSKVALNPENGGLESVEFDEKEYLEQPVDLGGVGEDTKNSGIYGSAFGKVTVYTGTSEVIFQDLNATFEFKNFSKLYWEADGSEIDLAGQQTFRQGSTDGFVLSGLDEEDYAVTFTGDMEAEISQDSTQGTAVEVNGSEVKMMLHRGGLEYGKKRVQNHVDGQVYFGAKEQLAVATEASLNELKDLNSFTFSDRFTLQSYGYNISGALERGSEVPLQPATVKTATFPKSDWNGSLSWQKITVTLWQ
ncbi:hypothetical protein [Candidatus Nanohalococcus occultus]|uniref:hypothetical protein n=1 Tax=Candidatus Nanohalococcus occultus TaxID=2978047 RepID=UPI0039E1AF26